MWCCFSFHDFIFLFVLDQLYTFLPILTQFILQWKLINMIWMEYLHAKKSRKFAKNIVCFLIFFGEPKMGIRIFLKEFWTNVTKKKYFAIFYIIKHWGLNWVSFYILKWYIFTFFYIQCTSMPKKFFSYF